MQEQRHPFKEIDPLDKRLEEEAKRLRQEARGTPQGVERERLLRRARQVERTSYITDWLNSPGLKPPT
jgi:hypothetical protein